MQRQQRVAPVLARRRSPRGLGRRRGERGCRQLFLCALPLVTQQVRNLRDIEERRHARNRQHEVDEDGLLGGARNVTPGTAPQRARRRILTVEIRDNLQRAEDVELSDGEARLQDDLEHQLGQVRVKQDAFDFHLASFVRVLGGLCRVPVRLALLRPHGFLLLVDDEDGVAEVDQRGGRHERDLQHPVVHVGHGEQPVIAGVFASRFFRVAVELGQLVPPHVVRGGAQDEDPEHEQDAHPDLSHHGGMSLDLVEKIGQVRPVAHGKELTSKGEEGILVSTLVMKEERNKVSFRQRIRDVALEPRTRRRRAQSFKVDTKPLATTKRDRFPSPVPHPPESRRRHGGVVLPVGDVGQGGIALDDIWQGLDERPLRLQDLHPGGRRGQNMGRRTSEHGLQHQKPRLQERLLRRVLPHISHALLGAPDPHRLDAHVHLPGSRPARHPRRE